MVVAMIGVLAGSYYMAEPWAVTFVDDGPYYSEDVSYPLAELQVLSAVELERIGTRIYSLESRVAKNGEESVLVLRNPDGTVRWQKKPLKPDGKLGLVALRPASPTWYGGWRVPIAPSGQEAGQLYLGPLGGFRFFNHSW